MSNSVGLEGVRADKRLLILPALFFLSPFVTAAVPRLTWLFLALIAIALGVRARARIILWEYTAERVLEQPWLGIGVDSTHTLNRRGHVDQPQGFVFPRSSGEHAHNLFLQTWYELGLIGAVLLALAGAAIALRMLRLPKDIQPIAAASFAAFFGIAAFAWSIWQTWFMCAIGLLILYVCMSVLPRARRARKQAGSQPPRDRLRRAEGVWCN